MQLKYVREMGLSHLPNHTTLKQQEFIVYKKDSLSHLRNHTTLKLRS